MKTYHVATGRVVTFHALCLSHIVVRQGDATRNDFHLLDGETLQVDATVGPVTEALIEVRSGTVMTSNELVKHRIINRLKSGMYGRIQKRWEQFDA